MIKHYYGMRLRGISPGCQPKGWEYIKPNQYKTYRWREYWDIIAYDHKLSENDIRNYEFDYLGEYDDA